jgi:hypothetical protein
MTLIEAKVDANGGSLCENFNEEISHCNKPNRSAIYSDWYKSVIIVSSLTKWLT